MVEKGIRDTPRERKSRKCCCVLLALLVVTVGLGGVAFFYRNEIMNKFSNIHNKPDDSENSWSDETETTETRFNYETSSIKTQEEYEYEDSTTFWPQPDEDYVGSTSPEPDFVSEDDFTTISLDDFAEDTTKNYFPIKSTENLGSSSEEDDNLNKNETSLYEASGNSSGYKISSTRRSLISDDEDYDGSGNDL